MELRAFSTPCCSWNLDGQSRKEREKAVPELNDFSGR